MKVNKKIPIILAILVLILLLVKFAPTLGNVIFQRDKEVIIWDGTIANSFEKGKGTEVDPFIINTPNEFILMLDNKYNKEDYYYKIDNNLYFNDGIFEYDKDKKEYIYYLKTNKYYLNDNEKYYKDKDFKEEKSSINILDGSYNFKGHIEGQNHFLYGIYINNENSSLFNNFNGTLSNLKISNSLIISKNNSSIINNCNKSTLNNIMFNGNLISNNEDEEITNILDNISISKDLEEIELPIDNNIINYTLKGNTDNEIEINDVKIKDNFNIDLDNKKLSIKVKKDTNLTNLEITFNNRTTSSFINNSNDTTINNLIFKGNSISNDYSTSLINNSNNSIINNSYNTGTIVSNNTSGLVNNVYNKLTINNSYNNGNLIGNYTNGIINNILDNSDIVLNNIINFKDNTNNIINSYKKDKINNKNIYYLSDNDTNKDIANNISKDKLLKVDKLKELDFDTSIWDLEDDKIPVLKYDDVENPSIEIEYENYKWNNIHEVKTINIKDKSKFSLNASDKESDILKIEYYLDDENTKLIENYKDLEYKVADEVSIDGDGSYILYVKVTDTSGNVSYANTDRLVLNNINMLISFDKDIYKKDVSVSSDCPISYQINTTIYNDDKTKIYLETDNKLIYNTYITLIDVENDYKEYTYYVDNKDVIRKGFNYYYPIDVFKIKNNIKNKTKINYVFKFDYSNTEFQEYTSKISFVVMDKDENIVSNVKEKDIKEIKVVKAEDIRFNIETKDTKIDMNKINNNDYKIKIKENLEGNVYSKYKYGDYRLITYITHNDLIVKDENIKDNIAFYIYNNNYYLNDKGTVEIPIRNYSPVLNIKTINNYNIIKDGEYYLNIKLQNIKTNKRDSNIIKIPIVVDPDVYNEKYSFEVKIDKKDTYLDKSKQSTYNEDKNIDVEIKYEGGLEKPKVILKLSRLVNKNYEQVKAKKYFKNFYQEYGNNVIIIGELKNEKTYNLKVKPNYENLEKGTYKMEFLLYNRSNKVSKYETNIIVG